MLYKASACRCPQQFTVWVEHTGLYPPWCVMNPACCVMNLPYYLDAILLVRLIAQASSSVMCTLAQCACLGAAGTACPHKERVKGKDMGRCFQD